MARDYYSTLGVTPASEAVVIHAAYRALMRLYHPDMKPGPDGERRVREITEAYATLRDPDMRADYDRLRSEKDPLLAFEMGRAKEPPVRRPPAGRNMGLAAMGLAGLAVLLVWNTPRQTQSHAPPPVVAPAAEPAPGGASDDGTVAAPARPAPGPARASVDRPPPARAAVASATPIPAPARSTAAIARPAPVLAEAGAPPVPVPVASSRRPPTALAKRPAREEQSPACAGMQCTSDRLTALENHQNLLFTQSLGNADDARRVMLDAARESLLARRTTCRSESCVAGAYLDHFKEVTAIMEGGARP